MPDASPRRAGAPTPSHVDAPTITVVVATNRAAPYLAEALASVVGQTMPAHEVLVIDDGSPDPAALAALVAGFPEVRLERRAHAGVSAARNAGAQAATGAWVAFLDDDDRWDPRRLELQAEAIRADPDAVLAYCGMRSIDETGREIAPADQVAVTGRADVARRRTGIFMGNAIVRRDAYWAVGGLDTSLRLAEDLDLVLRLAGAGPFAFTPGALVDYRAHGTNVTGRYRDLVRAISLVLTNHRAAARAVDDAALVAAFDESLRANARFAWWSAGRAARAHLAEGAPFAGLADVAWAVRQAPAAPLDALVRRVRHERLTPATEPTTDPAATGAETGPPQRLKDRVNPPRTRPNRADRA